MFTDLDVCEYTPKDVMNYRAVRATNFIKDLLINKPNVTIKVFDQHYGYMDGELVETEPTSTFYTEAALA